VAKTDTVNSRRHLLFLEERLTLSVSALGYAVEVEVAAQYYCILGADKA